MTFFILTHIKRFFIMFQTNYWTDVFVLDYQLHPNISHIHPHMCG